MAYVMVLFAALVSGALVFWLTLRAGRSDEDGGNGRGGSLPDLSSGAPYPGDADVYVPVGSDQPSWQTRVIGVLGLLIAITLAAAVLAFSLYQVGSVLAKLLSKAAS